MPKGPITDEKLIEQGRSSRSPRLRAAARMFQAERETEKELDGLPLEMQAQLRRLVHAAIDHGQCSPDQLDTTFMKMHRAYQSVIRKIKARQ